jgi:hypothetical protein
VILDEIQDVSGEGRCSGRDREVVNLAEEKHSRVVDGP